MSEPARGAVTLHDLLEAARSDGFDADINVDSTPAGDADHPLLHCSRCDGRRNAAEFERRWSRRLEGSSDPADLLHVSGLVCPNCHGCGVLVLPFGPAADADQADALRALSPTATPAPRPDSATSPTTDRR